MVKHLRLPLTALFLGLALLCQPLAAQLNPKLQSSKTDFLNLYQQSTNTRVKPEILTVFDFSGSMEYMMYHPLYVNTDVSDSDTDRLMSFQLTKASDFTIKAAATGNTSAYATLPVSVGGTIGTATNTGVKGTSNAYYSITTSSGSTVDAITISPSGTITAETVVTFTAYVTLSGSNASDKNITWSWVGTSGGTLTATSAGSTSSPYKWTCTWTVPKGSYVTATLDPRAGSSPLSNITYLTQTLSSTILVKPDGTQVKASDAALASSSGSGLYGASSGAADVRNWVRAASHVRFSATVGSNTRVVDVPIPWAILNSGSGGTNPLTSTKVFDRQTKTAANGTVTLYGSGTYLELDSTYALNSGSNVLSGSSSARTSTTLSTVSYKAGYVSWLFTGKYLNGTYAGSYIVFDAATPSLAGGQDSASWGQGFGSAATGTKIKVPVYNMDGTYASKETDSDASVNIVPALTRVQAVKRAAITTWINHQADVLWAFRFLDVTPEAASVTTDNWGNYSYTAMTTIDNDSSTELHTSSSYGTSSGWRVLNNTASQGITSTSGNSVTGVNKIASLLANNGTPLTYAMARGLAQFTDPNNIFNTVETGSDAPSQCMNHFLILFTDGIDNNGISGNNTKTACPYYIASGTTFKIDALAGNKDVILNKTKVNTSGDWWNLFTYAGIAAHLGDTSVGTVAGTHYLTAIDPGTSVASSAVPSSFLPLSLYKRGSTVFLKPHLVTTMTVGVSLGGFVTSTTSPKRSLFIAAAVGDPTLTDWPDVNTLKPFEWDATANSGTGGRVSGSIYFFDATDPDKLSTSLDYAILSAIGASNINTASNPTTPYIGSALGGEIFIGKFQPPLNGGAIWNGDLLMFPTKLVGDTLNILNKTGSVTTTLDSTTAQWSASKSMISRGWTARKLYTRLPGSTSYPEPGLMTFNYTGTPWDTLKHYISQGTNNPSKTSYTVGSTAQNLVAQWAMGGDISTLNASNVATGTRSNIMGDIINSSPAALEYFWSDVSSSIGTYSSSILPAVGGDRFRLILVGDNQGWLHAFGEVSKKEYAVTGDSTTPIISKGDVDELWAFMPTDFLGYLDQLTVKSNPHRFLVDGAPAIYHLDLAPSTGGSADGVVEVTTSPGPERALVIFGLGKGGRSYYALDIHNPFVPSMKWSIVPDEVDLVDGTGNAALQARILSRPGAPDITTVQKVIRNMGFSTCTPGLGRVTVTDSSGYAIVRDAVFLGGGFSVPEVEANFLDGSGNPTPMGRSVLALDAYSGLILAAVDLSSSTTTNSSNDVLTPGPIYRGVIPFEFILGSGMAQRAYFLDYWGGLWSWGSQKTDTVATLPSTSTANPTYKYRIDSSDLSSWTMDGTATGAAGIRLVAKDMSGSLVTLSQYTTAQKYYTEALYTTLPAPYRIGTFPGQPKTSTGPIPATVGIAITSGDRNNPLDYLYTTAATTSPANPATKPSHHRVSVIFDRQDSLAWGSVANPIIISPSSSAVLDVYPSHVSYQASDALITPYSSTYFLAPSTASNTRFGYFFNFPDISANTGLIPKGINTPTVVSGSLYYSVFVPTEANSCSGGNGVTNSNLMCDTLYPIVSDTRSGLSCTSGNIWNPVGVASDYIALGTRGVIQIGTTSVTNPSAGASATAIATRTITGQATTRYPKARVWRTVH